jgi:glycogen(starch) synthase
VTWLLENIAIRRATVVVGVSRFVFDRARDYYTLSGLRNREPRVVYNGVDTAVFRFAPHADRDPESIVFVGTMKPIKGVDSLIEAFKAVARQRPSLRLDLYGRDTEVNGQSYLHMVIENSDLPDAVARRIRYYGPIDHSKVPEVLQGAALCVIPSRSEAFVSVAVEAMATGTPVICGAFSSATELISHGQTGLICETGQPDDLASRIDDILDDPEGAREMGLRASSFVQAELSFDANVARSLQCIGKYRE